MLLQFKNFISENKLLNEGEKILLAVSGGVDSVVMAYLFHQSEIEFGIAHCNFALREKDSDEDEMFVKNLALNLRVPFYSIGFQTKEESTKRKISIQMVARDLRYEWFEKIRSENGFSFIATAHHRGDVLETMLLNFVRGTGIAGLHGIPSKTGHLIRPLLFADKYQILNYVKAHQIEFRQDASNDGIEYRRNLIRHQVVPILRQINPSLEKTAIDNANRFKDVEKTYNKFIDTVREQITFTRNKKLYIDILKLQKTGIAKSVLFEILHPYSFHPDVIADIVESIQGTPGAEYYSHSHLLTRDREFLIVEDIGKNIYPGKYIITHTMEFMEAENHKFVFEYRHRLGISEFPEPLNFGITPSNSIQCLDVSALEFPLTLRPWMPGDYFYPLGLHGRKKISDLLIDRKIAKNEKANIFVLISNDEIACVSGLAVDERFALTRHSTRAWVMRKG